MTETVQAVEIAQTAPEQSPRSIPDRRVFIDTAVFVVFLVEARGPAYRQSQRFFKDIEEGKMAGIVTTFTRMEFQGVIRRLFAKRNNAKPSDAEIATMVNNFEEMVRRHGIVMYKADDLIPLDNVPLFEQSEKILSGSVAVFNPNSNPKEWQSIGGADALHLVFSIRTNANEIASFDYGFKGINVSGLKPIILPEVYL